MLSTSPASAKPPCPGKRFLTDRALVSTTASFDPIALDASGRVTLADTCGPAKTKRQKLPRGVRLQAKLGDCGSVPAARLVAKVNAPTCTTVSGKLAGRGVAATAFTAAASTCGDGRVDAGRGEECDAGVACGNGNPCQGCTCTLSGATGLFQAPNPWNLDVSAFEPSPESAGIIGALDAAGGWGTGQLRIDFSIPLLWANAATPKPVFTQASGYYSPDCDDPFPFPLPPDGSIETSTTYRCDRAAQDCHILVVDAAANRLYEAYQADVPNGSLLTTCAITWDLTRTYPDNVRGEQCTSADAAGLPIGGLLATADEVASGEVRHALRLILPNDRMRAGVYVHPASHAGAPSGGAALPPYGTRFRLRSDFPLDSLPSDGARVIARAMQKYGLLLADGGNLPITMASDTYSLAKWQDLGIDSNSLQAITVTDMQVVGLGAPVTITNDCVRNP